MVTVPTVRHAAHLPQWADRAVLLGHFLSCPATNSPSVPCVCRLALAGLYVCMCKAAGFQSGQFLDVDNMPALLDGTVSLGNL